jgi:hypothetical protein
MRLLERFGAQFQPLPLIMVVGWRVKKNEKGKPNFRKISSDVLGQK